MSLYHMPLRILLVDDDPISRSILEEHLAAAGHDVFSAESAARAMYTLERTAVHIVIADWIMPDVSGLDLCKWVRGRQLPRSPHFVILTVHNDTERLVEAFEAGADDFLSKPFCEAELLARFRAWTRLVTLQEELAVRHQESVRLTSELIALNQKLSDLASRDELTGLENRREAVRRIEEQSAISVRYNRPLTCAVVDVDFFKQFNDSHGHAIGDQVLRHVAAILKSATRAADAVFRMGGDEFLIMLPDQTIEQAAAWAERCRQAVAEQRFSHQAPCLEVTVSIGLAERSSVMATVDALLEAADAALYTAKREGRNVVRRAEGLVQTA